MALSHSASENEGAGVQDLWGHADLPPASEAREICVRSAARGVPPVLCNAPGYSADLQVPIPIQHPAPRALNQIQSRQLQVPIPIQRRRPAWQRGKMERADRTGAQLCDRLSAEPAARDWRTDGGAEKSGAAGTFGTAAPDRCGHSPMSVVPTQADRRHGGRNLQNRFRRCRQSVDFPTQKAASAGGLRVVPARGRGRRAGRDQDLRPMSVG